VELQEKPGRRERLRRRIGKLRPRLPGRKPPEPPVPPPPPSPPPSAPPRAPTFPWLGGPAGEPTQRPEAPKPFEPPKPTEATKPPKPPRDLAFRLRTRLRAIGYWLREKGRPVWRQLKRGTAAVGAWWSRRSRGTKGRIFAVAGVVLLYLLVRYASIPEVPCEISAAKECAPSNDTIAYAPRDAVIYAHLTVNSDSHQWELAKDLRDELPNFTALLQSDTSALATPAGKTIDLSEQVLPWAKDDLALIGVPGPQKTTAETYVVGVSDEGKANQFLASLSPGGPSKHPKVGGVTLTVYSNGLATGFSGDQALFGNVAAVHAALDAKDGRAPQLEGSPPDDARESLPDVRLAEMYLSRAGVQRLLAGSQGSGATQLDTFVDYGATSGMAASLRVRDDGLDLQLDSRLDPKLEPSSPTVFAALPRFDPDLAGEAASRALGYVGVGDLGPALNEAITTAGATGQGLAGSLRQLAQSIQKQAGVDPLKDLLPALGGQAALIAEPTAGVPYASLIVDGVDEQKAAAALAALQKPLQQAVGAGERVPSFQTKDVNGVDVHSVQLSASVDLSYAVFDDKLVISTQPEGIEQVRSGGDNLADSDAYRDATDPLPDRVSALVFLNLDEVFGLAQQAGLATDPLYASLSEDISRIGSLGLAVTGSDSELRSQLFLAIDH
jgi:hypothetical protein